MGNKSPLRYDNDDSYCEQPSFRRVGGNLSKSKGEHPKGGAGWEIPRIDGKNRKSGLMPNVFFFLLVLDS